MKKQTINQPLYTEELEKLQLDSAEQEAQQILEEDLVPSPSALQKYNQLVPNGAERILTIIEAERKHRRKMEKSKLDGRNVIRILGTIFGFVLGIITIVAVMDSGDSRFAFALLWAATVVILGIVFSSFIKEKLGGRSEGRDY